MVGLDRSVVAATAAVLLLLLILLLPPSPVHASTWATIQKKHKLARAAGDELKSLAELSDRQRFRDDLLRPMLRTRVSDTPGNRAVQQHIKSVMTTLGWSVAEDRFRDMTPYGRRSYTNIVATQAPDAPRRLTFACHFDSKNFTEFVFIGATDSAVPCAMLLDMATSLRNTLFSAANKAVEDVSLQFIFFDGEEAQAQWTNTDSLYGSRHLAATMQTTNVQVERDVTVTQLQTMDALILLDLVGTSTVKFSNSYTETNRLFLRLQDIEKRLGNQGLLSRRGLHIFPDATVRPSYVADDHVPFHQRGVPVMHLIASPFPIEWHTENDNEACLDFDVINDLNVILRTFAAEYLHLV